MARQDYIEIFQDTLRRIQEDEQLVMATQQMQRGSMLYLRSYEDPVPATRCASADKTENIICVEDTSFHCAQQYASAGKKTTVLNFANAFRPGGGVTHGARAQEEDLCRCSNLYFGLTLPYFQKNYYQWNGKNVGQLGTDHALYHPGVTVIKNDQYEPLAPEARFQVDVITSAAPHLDPNKKPVEPDHLAQVFYHRIKNILEIASAHDTEVLILGAFGCGAFGNPPELVAEQFYHLLVENEYSARFEKVVFAIKRNDWDNSNLLAFRDAFPDT